jgi:CelD/BcsL family acetyltransferase involved in cellulose biosynthesis
MSTNAWRITVHQEPDEVRRLLETPTLTHGPFQDPHWLACWYETLGRVPGVTALVVAIRSADDDRLRLLLPLIRQARFGCARLLAWDSGVGDYNGPLVAADFAPTADVLAEIWHGIRAALPKADVIEIHKTPERVGGRINPFIDLPEVRRSDFSGHPLPLAGGFERLVETRFDGTNRRSLVRKRRKLAAKGRLDFAVASGEAAIPDLERVLCWRSRRFPTAAETAADGRNWGFYRRLVATAGIARVATLSLDGVPVAGCFGTVTGSSFQLIAIGHEERWNNWSPGMLAIEDMIAWACDQGLESFDFTVGEEGYKFAFGVDRAPLFDLCVPLTLAGRLVLVARALRGRLRQFRQTRNRRLRSPGK